MAMKSAKRATELKWIYKKIFADEKFFVEIIFVVCEIFFSAEKWGNENILMMMMMMMYAAVWLNSVGSML